MKEIRGIKLLATFYYNILLKNGVGIHSKHASNAHNNLEALFRRL